MHHVTGLLLILGVLGATDILLYHSVSHGIREHEDSRLELITHFLRGPTYAALFLLIPFFALHGWYFWLLMAILLFDVGISVVDFWLERDSRQKLGGLPSGEYVLHMMLAMIFGGMAATLIIHAGHWRLEPSGILWQPAWPVWMLLIFPVMAMMVLVSSIMDLRAALRSCRKARQ